MTLASTDDRVYFPVAQSLALLYDGRTLFNTCGLGQFASPIMAAIAFAALLLAAQVVVQVTASPLVSPNVLVDPLMANLNAIFLHQPTRNLLRAPVLAKQLFYHAPVFWPQARSGFVATLERHFMRLPWSVATLPVITPHFAGNGRFMHFQYIRNFTSAMPGFQQGRNLVSLFLGNLGVGSHECSFDLVV
jgi:hypothetical protein